MVRISLGWVAPMVESPTSASTRPLLVINDIDIEVLKVPLIPALDVLMIPSLARTDFNNSNMLTG